MLTCYLRVTITSNSCLRFKVYKNCRLTMWLWMNILIASVILGLFCGLYFTIQGWRKLRLELQAVSYTDFHSFCFSIFSTVLSYLSLLPLSVQNIVCPFPHGFFLFTHLHRSSMESNSLQWKGSIFLFKYLKGKVKKLIYFVQFSPLTNTPYILYSYLVSIPLQSVVLL